MFGRTSRPLKFSNFRRTASAGTKNHREMTIFSPGFAIKKKNIPRPPKGGKSARESAISSMESLSARGFKERDRQSAQRTSELIRLPTHQEEPQNPLRVNLGAPTFRMISWLSRRRTTSATKHGKKDQLRSPTQKKGNRDPLAQ